jgi:hypothetical protein
MILVVQGLRIVARYAERRPGFIVFGREKNWEERIGGKELGGKKETGKKCFNLYDPACRTKPSI